MAQENKKQETVEATVVDEAVVEEPKKKGILTKIGEGLTKAGEKLDDFNQKHKVVSTIITLGTGVAIGAGTTVAYVKHAQTGIGVSDDDEFDDDAYEAAYASYDDPAVSNDQESNTTTE